jgi:MoaA/NifB/PqqE/SkfB family radical SAM enzyme
MSQPLSIDAWYQHVIKGNDKNEKIRKQLKTEVPARLSVIFERACTWQCKHCIFQKEETSKQLSQRYNLKGVVTQMAKQMPERSPEGNPPLLIHEGRILTAWHLDVLDSVKSVRPDMNFFLIDNGKTLTACQDTIQQSGFRFDTIDISLDGTKEIHDTQRDDPEAFAEALNGLSFARDVSDQVTSLFTITSINHESVKDTASLLLGGNRVDTWHITGMSPARPKIKPYAASEDEWQTAWEQLKETYKRWPDRTFVHLYNHHDLKMVAQAADQSLSECINTGGFGVEHGQIVFALDGVKIEYSPLSIWPQETFLIDSDAACRVAYSLAYTLDELRSGTDRFGNSCDQYTVKQLHDGDALKAVYKNCVDQWWEFKGEQYLKKERELFSRLL